MTDWRSIITAPQDGTEIEVKNTFGRVFTAHWRQAHAGAWQGFYQTLRSSTGVVIGYGEILQPFEWRPKP